MVGPDSGIRFNLRIGRFIKSYLTKRKWRDNYYYLQGQGYWIIANWALFKRTNDVAFRDIALQCSEEVLRRQRDDGAWIYPNPEWKGRIATVEGTWGSLGLLETFRQTGGLGFLQGALRWHAFLVGTIGFQRVGDELAVNYFAHRATGRVPNNTSLALQFLAELAGATRNVGYRSVCPAMVNFLRSAQRSSGEFPYTVRGPERNTSRLHYQCYQYNAFQCLDLVNYYQMTADSSVLPIIRRVLEFLRRGLAEDGHARFDCRVAHPAVTYHAGALGAAFARAGELGLDGYDRLADRAFSFVLSCQRPDGSFPHSQRDYGLLSDQRPYPRHLAMILYHLLVGDWTTRRGACSQSIERATA
ncbi:MAG: terpene cyclase/mutase family protein [Chloroflexi bacterium]|nr:terpene cyclase/mutase family protein [Chloroflexota bacterium]